MGRAVFIFCCPWTLGVSPPLATVMCFLLQWTLCTNSYVDVSLRVTRVSPGAQVLGHVAILCFTLQGAPSVNVGDLPLGYREAAPLGACLLLPVTPPGGGGGMGSEC